MEGNRPDYYKTEDMECWDVWKALDIFEAACVATVIKYLWRAGKKDSDYRGDLIKARTYLDKLINYLER